MPPAPVLTVTLSPAIDLELTIAEWPRGDMARATAARRSAGGKGVNVSRVLAALGVASDAFCLLGRGPDAAVFRVLLEGLPFGVETFEVEGTVRTNVTVTCASSARRLKVNQSAPALGAAAWRRVERALEPLLAGRQWIALSGALPPGAPEDAYARLVRLAHRQGAQVLLDCDGPSLLAALPARPDLIKPNREEITATLEIQCNTRAGALYGARELQRLGARRVIVSGGGAECLGLEEPEAGRYWLVKPPKIKAVGPMGAGDSLVAGVLAALVHGRPFPEALCQGIAAGAATAARPNTEFGKRADVRKLLKETVLSGPFTH